MNGPNGISEGRGMAIAGIVCGGIGVALGIVAVILVVWIFTTFASFD